MRKGLPVTLVTLALLGCRNPHVAMEFELLHHELRNMENHIFQLEDELDAKSQQLTELQQHGDSTTAIDDITGRDGNEEYSSPSVILGPSDEEVDDSRSSPQELPDLREPEVQIPMPEDPPSPDLNPSREADVEPDDSSATDNVLDEYVTHVTIKDGLTSGLNSDGIQGDDGLLIVVEPRNTDGQYVPLTGDIEVAALDSSQTGVAAEIARWEVDALEASRSLRNLPEDEGIYLELPWEGGPPASVQLKLMVRYETSDGRVMEASQRVLMSASGTVSDRWTPSSRLSRRGPTASQKLTDSNMGTGTNDSLAIPRSGGMLPRLSDRLLGLPPHRSPATPVENEQYRQSSLPDAHQVNRRPAWRPLR